MCNGIPLKKNIILQLYRLVQKNAYTKNDNTLNCSVPTSILLPITLDSLKKKVLLIDVTEVWFFLRYRSRLLQTPHIITTSTRFKEHWNSIWSIITACLKQIFNNSSSNKLFIVLSYWQQQHIRKVIPLLQFNICY